MDSCSVCVAGAYVWLRIFMLARDLGAKDRVCRMVYSGDISREKSCSGRWLTRRFLPSGLAMEGQPEREPSCGPGRPGPLLAALKATGLRNCCEHASWLSGVR